MKRILGLDLGTNSIGWALVKSQVDEDNKEVLSGIEAIGSRIIPMDAGQIGSFERGAPIETSTASRTAFRGTRHIIERNLLRRERLHRVLSIMGFLPKHYAMNLTRYGKFKDGVECKLPWTKDVAGKPVFLFQTSFEEMLADFAESQPELVSDGKRVPYDWTIYYLRNKALTKKVSKEELAWILLNFNQKRGYYQLRGEEEEENPNKQEEYYALKVVAVEDSGEKKGKDTWYNVHLENGMIYRRSSSVPLDWVGKVKEFIVTTNLDSEGNPKKDKEGNISRSFRAPNENDWTLLKKRTEANIDRSKEKVGTYIYKALLANSKQKIRGKLVRTIERKYYKQELRAILETQTKFHEELNDTQLYIDCINELYPINEGHRNILINRSFADLFINDIIFYQRPLKSQKSLIDNCKYEKYIDKNTGEKIGDVKCIAKSHPLFQEFRLWQFVSNLRIYKIKSYDTQGRLRLNVDVTSQLLPTETAYVELFDWLNDKKEISQGALLKYQPFNFKKAELSEYRWNYVEDKVYPCNETRGEMLKYLAKAGVEESFLTEDKEEALWHILYSIDDKQELEKALKKYAEKNGLDKETFAESFKKIKPFEKDYGAYSAKAIKKLLPLMRIGNRWDESKIDANTKERINHIIDGEYDETIKERVRNKAIGLTEVAHFRGLPLWLACYVVYDRHSESGDVTKWTSPEDIDEFLCEFKQHSLRNPIVEQVVTETLRVVRDIWKQYGNIDEIHLELGRELKKTADERRRLTENISKNENTNLRIKALLAEFVKPEYGIDNVRPYSPYQQDLLRIYEEGALNNATGLNDEILDVVRRIDKEPSKQDIMRYKLWLDQKYRSPYTGRTIPLSKLFTPAYEIEHIIPKSRFFDNSMNNKVICEAEVNHRKGSLLGHEFIKQHHGEIVEISLGSPVKILSLEEYEDLVAKDYSSNNKKAKILLMDEIPEEFINRQMNDSRYISRVVMSLLSNIVRDNDEIDATSKHLIPCNGAITDRLKKDWGVNDVWNKIILPRFERMNKLDEDRRYTSITENGHTIPSVPFDLQKGFNKKRIDHRHHAMDAIVIACASRNIVNYLNNQSALSPSKQDWQRLLCHKATDDNGNYQWEINKPWTTFTQDVLAALMNVVVSFKQNLRVINKATNYYEHYDESGKKKKIEQKGTNWAIRKPMHKETCFGEVNLRKIKTVPIAKCLEMPQRIVDKDFKRKVIELLKLGKDAKEIKKYFESEKDAWSDVNLQKIQVYYYTKEGKERYFATRKDLIGLFDKVTDRGKAEGIIESITDTGIQKILRNHLQEKGGDPKLAFSPEGIDEMNANIMHLNDGVPHQPIYKVRKYEVADKFAVGEKGNKSSKFVEAAKGTNLFFACYVTETVDKKTGETVKVRSYDSIPLNVVIDRLKRGLSPVPEDENGNKPTYVLSPNDLVYVPTADEIKNGIAVEQIKTDRIYKMISCNKYQAFFTPFRIASPILRTTELGSNDKSERAWDGTMIKEVCVPIKVDRLGNIIKIG